LDKGVKAAGHSGFVSGDFGDEEVAVKLGALALEYESLLTAQLGEQRRYFERLLAKVGGVTWGCPCTKAPLWPNPLWPAPPLCQEEAAGLAAAAEAGASPSQLEAAAALRASCEALESEHAALAEELRRDEAALSEGRHKQGEPVRFSHFIECGVSPVVGLARFQ
jgi:hypothetical protein